MFFIVAFDTLHLGRSDCTVGGGPYLWWKLCGLDEVCLWADSLFVRGLRSVLPCFPVLSTRFNKTDACFL